MLKTEFKSRNCSLSPRLLSAAVLLAILGTTLEMAVRSLANSN